jgi:FlaA1/EpsC-like NDP-sugar epimerase
MLFHARAMAIYVIAFVAVAYVVVNHLARSEIQASGEAILRGIKRPGRPIVLLALHPVADACVLAASFSLALFLTDAAWGLEKYKIVWFSQLPFWVGVPILFFVLSGVYSRVWSRARAADFTSLSAVLVLSLLLALGITGLNPDAEPRTMFVRWLIVLGLSQMGIAVRRVIPQSARDMSAEQKAHRASAARPSDAQLIYGAGDMGAMYIDHLFLSSRPEAGLPHVVGFADDSPYLSGRSVRGFRVLGGIERVEELVLTNGIRRIVLTADLSPERAARVSEIAHRTGADLVRWRADLVPAGNLPAKD